GCWACHQLGNKATREIPRALGAFETSRAAWERRILSGQAGGDMFAGANRLGGRALALFADWTDRIAAGELPPAPPRPQGLDRNVVITVRERNVRHAYLHVEAQPERHNPTINVNGVTYRAIGLSADQMVLLE